MISTFTFAWHCLASMMVVGTAKELEYPTILDVDEDPDITIDFDWLEVDPGFGGSPFRTRSLGGSVPGPTIMLSAGTTLNVHFRNLLEKQPDSYNTNDPGRYNHYGDPDVGNLHFHGGHVSSVLPADDTSLQVPPGESYNFSVPFPSFHAPGLHWVHPHHHGSSSLHLAGGAALALIVKDPPGSLPKDIDNAEEKVLIFQDWDIPTARMIARKAGDGVFEENLDLIVGGEDIGQRFFTINGMYQPTLSVATGVWQRWRMLYAGWQDLPLNFEMAANEAGCELMLLAKDGIFITDFPRAINGAIPIPPGGRADFMVRCNNAGTTNFLALSRKTLTVVSQESGSVLEGTAISRVGSLFDTSPSETAEEDTQALAYVPLTKWRPTAYPDYLQSVAETLPTDGCTCPFKLKGYDDSSTVNGEMYQPGNHFQHTTFLGAVVQRELVGIYEHSYHQHIYPFQLIGGFTSTDYFKYGDWHDTILFEKGKLSVAVATWIIRYRTTDIAGKMMVHCHNTMHADQGMMTKEYVRDLKSATCECGINGEIGGDGLVDDVNSKFIASDGTYVKVGKGGDGKDASAGVVDGKVSSAGSHNCALKNLYVVMVLLVLKNT